MFRRTLLALSLAATTGLAFSAPATASPASTSTISSPGKFLRVADFPQQPFAWRTTPAPAPEDEQPCLDAAGSWGGQRFGTRFYANDGDGRAMHVKGRTVRVAYAKNLIASANESVGACLRAARQTGALLGAVRRTPTRFHTGLIRTFRLTCDYPEQVGGCDINTEIVGMARAGKRVTYVHISTMGSISAAQGRRLANRAVWRALRS